MADADPSRKRGAMSEVTGAGGLPPGSVAILAGALAGKGDLLALPTPPIPLVLLQRGILNGTRWDNSKMVTRRTMGNQVWTAQKDRRAP